MAINPIELIEKLPALLAASAGSFSLIMVLFLGGIVKRGYMKRIPWYYSILLRIVLGFMCLGVGLLFGSILSFNFTFISVLNNLIGIILTSFLFAILLFVFARLYFSKPMLGFNKDYWKDLISDKKKIIGLAGIVVLLLLVTIGLFADKGLDSPDTIIGFWRGFSRPENPNCLGPRTILKEVDARGGDQGTIGSDVIGFLSKSHPSYDVSNEGRWIAATQDYVIVMLTPKGASEEDMERVIIDSLICSLRRADMAVCDCKKAPYLLDVLAQKGFEAQG